MITSESRPNRLRHLVNLNRRFHCAEPWCPRVHGEASHPAEHLWRRGHLAPSLLSHSCLCTACFLPARAAPVFTHYLGFFTAPRSEPGITEERSRQREMASPPRPRGLTSRWWGRGRGARAASTSAWADSLYWISLSWVKITYSFFPSSQSFSSVLCAGYRHIVCPCTLLPLPPSASWNLVTHWLPVPWSLKDVFIMRP